MHNGWIDLHGRVVQDYDPTADRPAAFDLQGVNRQAPAPPAVCVRGERGWRGLRVPRAARGEAAGAERLLARAGVAPVVHGMWCFVAGVVRRACACAWRAAQEPGWAHSCPARGLACGASVQLACLRACGPRPYAVRLTDHRRPATLQVLLAGS